jgi:phosphoglucomutase
MALMKDPITNLPLGDPENIPFRASDITKDGIEQEFKEMTLSASGWRKVFAAEGGENSLSKEISGVDKMIVSLAASIFCRCLIEETGNRSPVIAIGIDTRPTGATIADIVIRTILSEGGAARYTFITAVPEIMSYTRRCNAEGFIYITASHNPPGYNGIKFGLSNGAVISGAASAYLAERFRSSLFDPASPPRIEELLQKAIPFTVEAVYRDVPRCKADALQSYREFNRRVITGTENRDDQETTWESLKNGIVSSGIGIVAEFNGSTRGIAGDTQFLKEAGFKVRVENAVPGEIVHRIVPEGESLNLCKELLEKEYAYDPGFIFGYVPDNDGDRGNLVFMDEKTANAHALNAQEVFALSVLAELIWQETSREQKGLPPVKTTVAVNGPTSLRIDRIARLFGASVSRCEVGESNVVNLASRLRKQGAAVPILGEGSNGGNITHPSRVRDPIHTIFSMIKLLTQPKVYTAWRTVNSSGVMDKGNPTIGELKNSLPKFITTSVFEDRALLSIVTESQKELKENYEGVFLEEWKNMQNELFRRWGITGFYEVNYEGSGERRGFGPFHRTGSHNGGMKMIFTREDEPCAFLWMRGSRTEPVFRVMADVEGSNTEDEAYLLDWHKKMIKEADRLSSR